MRWTDKHTAWMQDTGTAITTTCGLAATIIRFNHSISDTPTMSAWAKHFRNHYCDDAHISYLIKDTPYSQSKADFLINMKFPAQKISDSHEKSGPATRAGDFSEILFADYISSKLDYWVPRVRYELKFNKNTSEQGSDVIGMKFDPQGFVSNDELLVVEVKATLSDTKNTNRLQDAINHSTKDEYRIGESLSAMKQRLLLRSEMSDVEKIGRFQNPNDRPYIMRYGAAAILTEKAYDPITLKNSSSIGHKYAGSLNLYVIVGNDMMNLAHHLYQKAADEA